MDNPPLNPPYTSLDDWIASESTPFSLDSPTFNAAVDRVIALSGDRVELLGLGEALHGGEEILIFRNRLFQYLVNVHGFRAIAVESSYPRAHLVDEYIAGRGPDSYVAVQDTGFSHGFGRLEANRELVEWMRQYNEDPSHPDKLRFYGFDSPTEMMYSDSPRDLLYVALDYLISIDSISGREYQDCIDLLIGQDADWENPEAMVDRTKSVGMSSAASALRIETEELITELQVRRPELVAKSDESRYLEAVHAASMARQLLTYHATVARDSNKRFVRLLGLRDAMMAHNLAYIVSREHGRGKVLAFAHNSHLKRGTSEWQLGSELHSWWPAGSHLSELVGSAYSVIGSGVGVSAPNGIDQPETGTIEAFLTTAPGPVRIIRTLKGKEFPPSPIADLPVRSGSMKNPTYFAFTPRSFTDFDWLVAFDSITYSRGGPPLQ